jgi:hypothetical protein
MPIGVVMQIEPIDEVSPMPNLILTALAVAVLIVAFLSMVFW